MVIVIVPLDIIVFLLMFTIMPRGRHVDPDAGATVAFALIGFYVIFFGYYDRICIGPYFFLFHVSPNR
jgi:hypothetical protein